MPPGALGATCAIVAWSFCCLAITLLLLWLVWVHGERVSCKTTSNPPPSLMSTDHADVALLAGTMSLSCLASIVQQTHTIVRWNDIKTEQWQNVMNNVGNPELNITGASTGLDLVVFYIQYYTYNVESLLVLFWYAFFGVCLAQQYADCAGRSSSPSPCSSSGVQLDPAITSP